LLGNDRLRCRLNRVSSCGGRARFALPGAIGFQGGVVRTRHEPWPSAAASLHAVASSEERGRDEHERNDEESEFPEHIPSIRGRRDL
jgi:hypothetical protein